MDEQRQKPTQNNIILLGIMGCGKSTIGWMFAKMIGYGFVDLDARIEEVEKLSIQEIFAQKGEAHFRNVEKDVIGEIGGIRSHVIATGGGAVIDDENWEVLQDLGLTVWVNTPPEEIARRLLLDEEELSKRPLLKEVSAQEDDELKFSLLKERIGALIGQRQQRYKEADIQLTDTYSTPESSAKLLREILGEKGFLNQAMGQNSFDRWQTL